MHHVNNDGHWARLARPAQPVCAGVLQDLAQHCECGSRKLVSTLNFFEL